MNDPTQNFGFNGFGQFGVDKKRVTAFTDIQIGDTDSESSKSGDVLISASWSYAAFASGDKLWLRGFLDGKPNNCFALIAPTVITQLSACDRFCLVLTEDGKVYKASTRCDAQLQELRLQSDDDKLPHPPQKRNIFGACTTTTTSLKATHIACGSAIAVALTSLNGVYSIPSKVHQFPKHLRVKQLMCGFEHALLLSSNGDVYSWGNGMRGQLGHDELRVREAPLLVDALAGVKITFIAAGGWHSAAISAFGDLYTWGFNSNGQLGLRIFKGGISSTRSLKNPSVYPLPQLIELPETAPHATEMDTMLGTTENAAVKVFAGARHTFLLMHDGSVYAVGWNAHGQLGIVLEGQQQLDEFKRVEDIGICTEITCAAWCTILRK